ncbi:DUF1902 domain-containing protein [Methylomarinum vadi]|uniref:DUF1902 domain-containing protein n=1 Tax=Methylomarinum vadi TaxID=438855 RepID=UPI0004DF9096|nr:DUF1902 domain-containing protein [Methylomarinum vadi]
MGATLAIDIDVIYDDDANVFIATSKDVPGLILEAESFHDLRKEIEEAILNLLNHDNHVKKRKTLAELIIKNHIAIA